MLELLLTTFVPTVKTELVNPAGTITEAGSDATDAPPLTMFKVAVVSTATGESIVNVALPLDPPTIVFGEKLKENGRAGRTVKVAESETPPALATTVATVLAATAFVPIAPDPLVAPGGRMIVPGAIAASPPISTEKFCAPAFPTRNTCPVADLVPVTETGLTLKFSSTGSEPTPAASTM